MTKSDIDKIIKGIETGKKALGIAKQGWNSSGLSIEHFKEIMKQRINPLDLEEVTNKIIEQNPKIAKAISDDSSKKKELSYLINTEYDKMKYSFQSAKGLDINIQMQNIFYKLKDETALFILEAFPETKAFAKILDTKYTKQATTWVDRLTTQASIYGAIGSYYLKEKIRTMKNPEERKVLNELGLGKKLKKFAQEELPRAFIDKGLRDPAEYHPITDMMKDYLMKKVADRFGKEQCEYKPKYESKYNKNLELKTA